MIPRFTVQVTLLKQISTASRVGTLAKPCTGAGAGAGTATGSFAGRATLLASELNVTLSLSTISAPASIIFASQFARIIARARSSVSRRRMRARCLGYHRHPLSCNYLVYFSALICWPSLRTVCEGTIGFIGAYAWDTKTVAAES